MWSFPGGKWFSQTPTNMGDGCCICVLRALSCTLVHDCCCSVCIFFCMVMFITMVVAAGSSASLYLLMCTLGTAKFALVLVAGHVRIYWLCQRGGRCLGRLWRRCYRHAARRRRRTACRSTTVLPVTAAPTPIVIENCCGEPKYALGIPAGVVR